MAPPKPDAAAASNARLLAQFFHGGKIFALPWLGRNFSAAETLKNPQIRRTLLALSQ
jgi:hypothetical protein